jgi:SpoVK/Ycf46/Vps4 family AAA+-type ATPase
MKKVFNPSFFATRSLQWKNSLLRLSAKRSQTALLYKSTNKYVHTKILYSTLVGLIAYKLHSKNVALCIEDEVIKRAKSHVDNGLVKMKQEFGTQMMTFPEINFDFKGGRYSVEFLIDQRKCDLFSVLVSFLQAYEANKQENGYVVKNFTSLKEGNVMTLQLDFEEYIGNPKRRMISKGTVYITGENTIDRPNFKFRLDKTEDISDADLQGFLHSYREANRPNQFVAAKKAFQTLGNLSNSIKEQQQNNPTKSKMDAIDKLEKLGVVIFTPDATKNSQLDWDYLAGYEKQKRDIEDTVLLALTFPQIYDDISKGTRMKTEPNRPKAVLFEGPPGTGKTTSAKIIAQQVNIPLIYMPIESIMSKYYGESEKKFAEIFDAAKTLGKAIIFIDEIDAIAGSREKDMHEASRRILSTLLRKIDSFESTTDVLLICATNRKTDLDNAMLSRIDLSIKFELPDKHSRSAIYQRYAKHLTKQELDILADRSTNMSGRNISDVCKDAERRFASKIIRKEATGKLPTIQDYIQSLESRISQRLA